MMAMGMTKYVGIFRELVCPAAVSVVSHLCFGGRWCFVAFWWCICSLLTVFGDALGILLMFWWCLGTFAIVSWRY